MARYVAGSLQSPMRGCVLNALSVSHTATLDRTRLHTTRHHTSTLAMAHASLWKQRRAGLRLDPMLTAPHVRPSQHPTCDRTGSTCKQPMRTRADPRQTRRAAMRLRWRTYVRRLPARCLLAAAFSFLAFLAFLDLLESLCHLRIGVALRTHGRRAHTHTTEMACRSGGDRNGVLVWWGAAWRCEHVARALT